MKNAHLVALIKSLSKAEKRYFKVNTSPIKTNKTLIKMFDVIEKEKVFSSNQELLRHLGLKSKQNLAVAETRLQSLILKQLRGFHSASTQSIELNNLLIEIEILYHKRLYKNCKKLIQKTKKMAIAQENQLALLSTLKWESFIEKEEGKYLQESQQALTNILNKEYEIIDSYKQSVTFKHHTFNLLLLSKNKALASLNEELEMYDDMVEKGFFEIDDEKSFDEKLYLLNFKGMYFMTKGNFAECLDKYIQLVDLIENSKRKNILKSNEYFLALNNLLLIQVMNKRYELYDKTLAKIYHQFEGIPAYEPLLFFVTKNYELGIYCEIGEVKRGMKIIPEIEHNLNHYAADINAINKLLFFLNVAIMYFFNQNYSKSIFWFNEFLNDYSIKKNDVTSNIYYYSHIINLLVHFEAENYDSIEYLYKESITNLKKIRPLNEFDKSILKFIQEYTDNVNLSKKKESENFEALRKKLQQLAKDPKQTTALQFFDFFAWIDSHLSQQRIVQIIKKKQLA